MVFSSGHVWMWELDHEESWTPKNWCFCTVVLEKTLESPLDCKEIQPVNPKGNQPWVFIGRTDAETEAPVLWPPDEKSWLIWKDPDAGKDWRQEEKETTEDEMVGWYHWFDGHEFEQGPGDGEGQGSLACCSSWVHRDLDVTECLNNNNFGWRPIPWKLYSFRYFINFVILLGWQKSSFGFSIISYGKTQMNFLANPVVRMASLVCVFTSWLEAELSSI